MLPSSRLCGLLAALVCFFLLVLRAYGSKLSPRFRLLEVLELLDDPAYPAGRSSMSNLTRVHAETSTPLPPSSFQQSTNRPRPSSNQLVSCNTPTPQESESEFCYDLGGHSTRPTSNTWQTQPYEVQAERAITFNSMDTWLAESALPSYGPQTRSTKVRTVTLTLAQC
ncbi:hypothetical protein B0T22DRAFT_443586 [Podospora appendiculata]|uniref:Uncharacterized protein n=1 Tax=Podospora appendiculata TaxID=314037 RepID=A0AAE0X2G6_9PEZI|nr:hypothetical protein B0T22DRAFT_443586 [Podospora appendiculata]